MASLRRGKEVWRKNLWGRGKKTHPFDLDPFRKNRETLLNSWVGFSIAMAHRATAAGDILLMPSRFEPCGLKQLYALNYGTVPLVHAVGGLRDTVVPYDPFAEPDGAGNGWLFDRADGGALRDAASHALRTYSDFRESFDALTRRGMEGAPERGWDAAAEAYENVLNEAKYLW